MPGLPVCEELDDGTVVSLDDVAGTVALLEDVEPGPLAMSLLLGLRGVTLDVEARVAVAAAWQRQAAWVAAQGARALAGVNADANLHPDADRVKGWEWRQELVAAELRWSPAVAGNRMEGARRLCEDLPQVFDLLEAGEVSERHARVVVEAVVGLNPAEAALVQAAVIEKAAGWTVPQLRRAARRAAMAAVPELAAIRAQEAAAQRRVVVRPVEDGMAELVATLPAADAECVFAALDAVAGAAGRAAEAAGEQPGPVGARRADALVGWAQAALEDPAVAAATSRRTEAQVVIDLPTLLGLADNPGELVGVGPIPGEVARALAVDDGAGWRRLVVEPVTGCLLDYGSEVYRPPKELRDYLLARDRRCRFPGCRRRAEACDVDHAIPHPHGPTASCNCACLCRRHHRMKTHGGWHLELSPDGMCTWTSPTGRVYIEQPHNQWDSW
jgi:hypothetical protein